MFFEVHRGLVGLGAMTVYRTAAQTAADIEKFGTEIGPLAAQGGLLTQQTVFKYAAAKGRVADLQKEVEATVAHIEGLNRQLEATVRALEDLGVSKAGDYLKMAAKMAVSAKIPLVGWLSIGAQIGSMIGIDLSFLDVFGSGKKIKQKAEALMKVANELMVQMDYWHNRRKLLQAEGKALAQTAGEGEKAVDVTLIAKPQHEDVKHLYEMRKDPSGLITGFSYQEKRKIVDTAESKAYGRTIFKTSEELAKRVALGPSGDRLPVGFQTIYSPVLEHGKIVAKVPQINMTLPGPVDRRVVYGGLLSGLGNTDTQNLVITSAIIIGIMVYFIFDLKKR